MLKALTDLTDPQYSIALTVTYMYVSSEGTWLLTFTLNQQSVYFNRTSNKSAAQGVINCPWT